MHGLELPFQLPSFRVQGDDRVRVEIGAAPITAIVIRTCRGYWKEDKPAYQIRRNRGPDIGSPGVVCSGLPRLETRFALRRDGMEGPAQRTTAGIERAHDPGWRVGADIVGDGRADNDQVADYRPGRGE